MSTSQAVRAASAALLSALLVLLWSAGGASAATDHVVITGGAVVPADQTAGDVIVIDGDVRIDGRATGDVVSVSGPIRVAGRVDGDVIAVSDRMFLAPTARVGGDLRYGDERPVVAPGASVAGQVSKEDWADAGSGWGWLSMLAWWLAVSVSTLIVGALCVWLAPGALRAAERAVREHLGATIGWGVAIAIGVPLLAIVALVTLVGIPFGIALLLAAIPVLLVAYATSAWLVGRGSCATGQPRRGRRCSPAGDPASPRPDPRCRRPRRVCGDGRRTRSAHGRLVARAQPGRDEAKPEPPAAGHAAPAA